MSSIPLNFIQIKNCQCVHCDGKDTIHAVSYSIPNGDSYAYVLTSELLIGGVVNKNPCPDVFKDKRDYSLTWDDLRSLKIQLEDMRFTNSDYIEGLEEERKRLIVLIRELMKGGVG